MLLSFVIITFLSACNSEEEVEEPEVIREGPPPLENPQYVDPVSYTHLTLPTKA